VNYALHGRRLAPSFLPSAAVLELTYRCNQDCQFCSCPWFAHAPGYDVRPELGVGAWKRVIRRLSELGVTSFAFTGGEPLLKEGVHDIIEAAAGCRVSHIETRDGGLDCRAGAPALHLLSNGIRVDDRALALCAHNDVQLSVSLPGLSTFARHTGGASADRPLAVLDRARNQGIRTVAGVTVTQQNLFELEATLEAALGAGAEGVLLNRFLPGGRGLRFANQLALSSKQITAMLDMTESVMVRAGRNASLGTELPACVVDPDRYEHIAVSTRCAAASDFFVVDPSGFLRVCNHSAVRLCHMDDIAQLKTNAYWRRFAIKSELPTACVGCASSSRCDGGCREAAHIVHGDPLGADPLLT